MPPRARTTAVVSVARGSRGARPEGLLAEALDAAEIHQLLGPGVDATRPQRAVVVVAMSPPAAVAASVVHELVDLLHERGWDDVAVGATLTALDHDRGRHQLAEVARSAGLLGTTRGGRSYQLVDLRDELAVAEVPAASVLNSQDVSRVWQEADLRILLSRNVTDPFDGFALGLAALQMVAPPIPGADRADVVADLHRYLPARLSIVDATTSSHGEAGDLVLDPLATNTVLAGTDALLVDVVAAQLQGADPASSRPVAATLAQSGLPAVQRIQGDLTPYDGWRAAHPLLRAMAQDIDSSPGLARILALLMTEDEMPDPVLKTARSALASVMSERSEPLQRGWVAGAGYTFADTAALVRAWQAVLAKDSVQRVERPLGFDPAAHSASEFDELPDFLEQFRGMLVGVPPGDGGVRWRTVDGATVFEVSRTVPAPYDEWCARVDVSRGISLMADYLGGRVVVMTHDRKGRPRRQAERNVYLPQPNYLALWGGRPIDVAKIELVEYGDDWCRLNWRTVLSPNGSATYDDGSLTFAAEGGQTRLTVLGRQLFTLPPYWQSVDLTRFPEVRDRLVEDAYRRFFTATFDNLEACYEGREFRVGRPAADPDGPLPTAMLSAGLDLAKQWLSDRTGSGPDVWAQATRPSAAADSGRLDADGFRHFPGADPG